MSTLITSAHAGGTGFGVTTSGVDTTGANLLVGFIWSTNGGTASLITDSKSNTWTAVTGYNHRTRRGQLSNCLAPTVGTGHTFISAVAADAIVALAFQTAGAMMFNQISGLAHGTQMKWLRRPVHESLIDWRSLKMGYFFVTSQPVPS